MTDNRTIALVAGVLALLTVATAVGQFLKRHPDRGLDPAAVRTFNSGSAAGGSCARCSPPRSGWARRPRSCSSAWCRSGRSASSSRSRPPARAITGRCSGCSSCSRRCTTCSSGSIATTCSASSCRSTPRSSCSPASPSRATTSGSWNGPRRSRPAWWSASTACRSPRRCCRFRSKEPPTPTAAATSGSCSS